MGRQGEEDANPNNEAKSNSNENKTDRSNGQGQATGMGVRKDGRKIKDNDNAKEGKPRLVKRGKAAATETNKINNNNNEEIKFTDMVDIIKNLYGEVLALREELAAIRQNATDNEQILELREDFSAMRQDFADKQRSDSATFKGIFATMTQTELDRIDLQCEEYHNDLQLEVCKV